MIACALCINGWPLDQCIKYFETSAALAFEKRPVFQALASLFGHVPLVVPAVQLVISLLVDSKYSAQKLERIQQDAYGINQSIVQSREAAEAGALLGVTLTSTDDTSTFVVTNYNGIGDRPHDQGMCGRDGVGRVPGLTLYRLSNSPPPAGNGRHGSVDDVCALPSLASPVCVCTDSRVVSVVLSPHRSTSPTLLVVPFY